MSVGLLEQTGWIKFKRIAQRLTAHLHINICMYIQKKRVNREQRTRISSLRVHPHHLGCALEIARHCNLNAYSFFISVTHDARPALATGSSCYADALPVVQNSLICKMLVCTSDWKPESNREQHSSASV